MKTRYVIGIDPDTRRLAFCRMARTASGIAPAGVGTIERANPRGRIDAHYDDLLEELMRDAKSISATVWLEGIFLGRNVRGFASAARVQGEVLAAARRSDVPVEVVGASTWQPTILGISRGRSELKAAAMQVALGLMAGDDDEDECTLTEHEADAMCIAMYGARHDLWRT